MQYTIRPIRPDDEPALVEFHHQLSEESVYMRYFSPLKVDVRTSHQRLITRCSVDYDCEIALVAEFTPEKGGRQIAGVARLSRSHTDNSAEASFIVADNHQNIGLGTFLLKCILDVARKENISRVESTLLTENSNMKDILSRAGFHFDTAKDGIIKAIAQLQDESRLKYAATSTHSDESEVPVNL